MSQRDGNAYRTGDLGDLSLGVNAAGNYAPLRVSSASATWIAAQPSNADYTSSAIDTARTAVAWLHLSLLNTSTPAGKFQVLGSVNGTDYVALNLVELDLYGSGWTFDEQTPTDVAVDGSTAVALIIRFENPPPYLKAFWDRDSGGTTGDRLNGRFFTRS